MGKRLIQQARGKGSKTYTAPSFKYKGASVHPSISPETISGTVINLVHCRGHSAPLALVEYDNKNMGLVVAAEGIRVGDNVSCGYEIEPKIGNTMPLKDIPEGSLVYNLENRPGDGGKLVRASGTFAKVTGKFNESVSVMLPSKKVKKFNLNCRASIGVVAGGGRTEKPFLKAGNKFFKVKATNKYWPRSGATSMNAVDHPFGGKRSSRKGRPTIAPRFAPPGRKVGQIRASRTGRKR